MSKPSWDKDSPASHQKRKPAIAKSDLLSSNDTLPAVIVLDGVLDLVCGLQMTSRYPLCDHQVLKEGLGAHLPEGLVYVDTGKQNVPEI